MIYKREVLLLSLFVLIVNIAGVESVSGSWSKNGVSMSGNHSASYIQPLDKRIQGSSAAHTPPNGPIDYIFVEVRLEDRCQNANGTWPAWHQFAYNVKAANNAVGSGLSVARGTIQDCIWGHEYRNTSRHIFREQSFSVNETHTLTSTN
ncbi:MAG: hypothetical protein WD751_09785 [Anaerolineales bacterium]